MAVYSRELKEQLIRKSLPPHNQRIADLGRESGLHVNTLYKWKRQLEAEGVIVTVKKHMPTNGLLKRSWPPSFRPLT